jgi:hypothetical protein
MNEVTFGKGYYHLNGEMEQWCKDNIGPGMWTYGGVNEWAGLGDNTWTIHSMFGNTTFTFKELKHLNWFVLRWQSGTH